MCSSAGPGAAITVALCGYWDHEPPCPLTPHHTATERSGERLRLRVLFAVEPAAEAEVRRRIEAALTGSGFAGATLASPAGGVTRWRLRDTRPGQVRDAEAAHAARLVAG
jgi:hypothetical protein